MDARFDPYPYQRIKGPPDLALHFIECVALDSSLTLAPGQRLVITDDLLNGAISDLSAIATAAVVSRDGQIARAALIPLSVAAQRSDAQTREKFEQLFELIEDTAFDPSVRDIADTLIITRFRESQIQELVHELGGSVGPARQRYRAFLDVVQLLAAKQITEAAFVDEFVDFTQAVAGKLDFGIYAICLDRLFCSDNIPLGVKTVLLNEVLRYPPLVRKELVTNLLSSAQAPDELVEFARAQLARIMTHDQLREIFLFTTLKLVWQARPQPV
jgi:hypothetical protein